MLLIVNIYVFLLFSLISGDQNESCDRHKQADIKYVLYDINPPEGFNLRRDVYVRLAVFMHKLQKDSGSNVKLVLPPWSNLYHWKQHPKMHLPWSYYFDLASLQKFAPVIEMYQFFNEIGEKYIQTVIDDVYDLQHFEGMFETGKFEEKSQVEQCRQKPKPNYFHFDNITAINVQCLSFHGGASMLRHYVTQRVVMFDHAEVALHDSYGDQLYWKARRSMKFNKDLLAIADHFRRHYLNSSNTADNTVTLEDWTKQKGTRNALGGPYLCVHMRRRDFVWGRPKDVPTLSKAAEQIKDRLRKLHIRSVFLATDAPEDEVTQLRQLLGKISLAKYYPDADVVNTYGDGGVAIIDQIICSYSRYFLGTYESTFSFRIQEEREILGFPAETTFNMLCAKEDCPKPSAWKIVW